MTSQKKIEANRANALQSTGPKSPMGKRSARRNALQHGMCANPAIGTVEDEGIFELLQAELVDCLQPRDIVEDMIVRRIALAMWRLERAMLIEAATATRQIDETHGHQAEVRMWIQQIRDMLEPVLTRDGESYERPHAEMLDRWRVEGAISKSGPAHEAMAAMLTKLRRDVEDPRSMHSFTVEQAQRLAWLLCDDAENMPCIELGSRLVHAPDAAIVGPMMQRIATSQQFGGSGEGVDLLLLIDRRIGCLRDQAVVVADPSTEAGDMRRQAANLLPAGDRLDRLLKYETHAQNMLWKCLDIMAKHRQVEISEVRAMFRATIRDGSSCQIDDERLAIRPWAT